MKLYGKQHLMEALKKEGLPCTKPTLLEYERQGIIPAPETIVVGSSRVPLYSKGELKNIVKLIKNHKK